MIKTFVPGTFAPQLVSESTLPFLGQSSSKLAFNARPAFRDALIHTCVKLRTISHDIHVIRVAMKVSPKFVVVRCPRPPSSLLGRCNAGRALLENGRVRASAWPPPTLTRVLPGASGGFEVSGASIALRQSNMPLCLFSKYVSAERVFASRFSVAVSW